MLGNSDIQENRNHNVMFSQMKILNALRHLRNYKLEEPLCKRIWRFLKNIKIETQRIQKFYLLTICP